MDQHQKQIETQLAELKAKTKWLEEEKETAIREKCDYTINQERLVENIQCMIWKKNMLIEHKIT